MVVSTSEPSVDVAYETRGSHLGLPDEIHILGFSQEARYLAHCLSATPELPPAQMLAHDPQIAVQWHAEQKEITVRGPDRLLKSHRIPCPEMIWPKAVDRGSSRIHNLVVDAGLPVWFRDLYWIRHRMSADTVVCLVNGGLGLIERVNETMFPNPASRPIYVLGEMSHIIRTSSLHGEMYSVRLHQPGKLHLGIPDDDGLQGKQRQPGSRDVRARHLTNLLMSAPGLNASVTSHPKWLRHKLLPMLVSATADAVSVLLNCTFDEIFDTVGTSQLWEGLWDETVGIIASLPELQSQPDIVAFFYSRNLKKGMKRMIRSRRGFTSKWVKHVRMGRRTPIAYINGYFVKRALETGASCSMNSQAVSVVKARRNMAELEQTSDIPMYSQLQEDFDAEAEYEPRTKTKYVYLPGRSA